MPVTQRTAPAGVVITNRAGGPINVTPRTPVPLVVARARPNGSTPVWAAEDGGVLHKTRICRCSRKRCQQDHRQGAGRWRGSRQRHSHDGGNDALIHRTLPRLSPVMPAPITHPRQVPLPCPDVGRHEVRLRASPKIWLEHLPWVVPDRPVVPLPILSMRPLPRAPARVVNSLHGNGVSGSRKQTNARCNRKRRRAFCGRTNRKN